MITDEPFDLTKYGEKGVTREMIERALASAQSADISITGEYNVYCPQCHDHHPKSLACGMMGVIRRVDEAFN